MQEQPPAHLQRGFSLLHATALNISNVVGVGPFITIPLVISAMGGPQAMLGWILGALLAVSDGLEAILTGGPLRTAVASVARSTLLQGERFFDRSRRRALPVGMA